MSTVSRTDVFLLHFWNNYLNELIVSSIDLFQSTRGHPELVVSHAAGDIWRVLAARSPATSPTTAGRSAGSFVVFVYCEGPAVADRGIDVYYATHIISLPRRF